MEKSVKELRRVAVEKAVNTNHCIEKSKLVRGSKELGEVHFATEDTVVKTQIVYFLRCTKRKTDCNLKMMKVDLHHAEVVVCMQKRYFALPKRYGNSRRKNIM